MQNLLRFATVSIKADQICSFIIIKFTPKAFPYMIIIDFV